MDRGDVVFFHGVDEAPAIKACLIHQSVVANKTFNAKTTHPNFRGVTYGLCNGCLERLEVDPEYVKDIEREIEQRITNIRRH